MGKTSFPDTWELVPLGELGKWTGGGTPSKSNPRYWTGPIPWVSPKDMKTERIQDSEDHITRLAITESATSLIPADSVLVVTRSGILRHSLPVAINSVPVTVNQDLKALTPRPGVTPEYVAWALRAFSDDILHSCAKQGTTVNSIETPKLLRFEIPVAPFDQQERIVAEIEKQFSRLDEAVANLKRVKANLKRYKAAVLKAAVEGKLTEEWRKQHPDGEPASELLKRILAERRTTWNGRGEYKEPAAPDATDLWPLPGGWIWATVEQLSTLVQYGSSAKCSEEAKGVPVLRMGNIENGKLLLNKLKYLPKDHDEFPSLFLSAGDLLFNRTNSAELVGKMAVYRGTPTPCSFASYLIRVRLSKHCVSDFLSYYINSVYGRSWIAKVVSQQVGQANVNGTKLQALPVPLLPLAEQERIVAEVERQLSLIEKLEATTDATLDHGDRLRQSVLGDVFSGQLAQRNAYARSGVWSDLPMAAEGDGIYKSNR